VKKKHQPGCPCCDCGNGCPRQFQLILTGLAPGAGCPDCDVFNVSVTCDFLSFAATAELPCDGTNWTGKDVCIFLSPFITGCAPVNGRCQISIAKLDDGFDLWVSFAPGFDLASAVAWTKVLPGPCTQIDHQFTPGDICRAAGNACDYTNAAVRVIAL